MDKRRMDRLIFGILIILLVGGILMSYITVKQSKRSVTNEQREVQTKAVEYLIHHYKGIKKMEIGKLDKPNAVGGGDYTVGVKINNTRSIVYIGAINKEEFEKKGPSIQSYNAGFPKENHISEEYDENRGLSGVEIRYTDKTDAELRK